MDFAFAVHAKNWERWSVSDEDLPCCCVCEAVQQARHNSRRWPSVFP